MLILIPFLARERLEYTIYGPGVRLAVTQGATQFDVNFPSGVGTTTSIRVDCDPNVTLSWNTTYSIVPLPGKSDFSTGFRVIFGAPAPAGAQLTYSSRVKP